MYIYIYGSSVRGYEFVKSAAIFFQF
jgi:hypothetical protein